MDQEVTSMWTKGAMRKGSPKVDQLMHCFGLEGDETRMIAMISSFVTSLVAIFKIKG